MNNKWHKALEAIPYKDPALEHLQGLPVFVFDEVIRENIKENQNEISESFDDMLSMNVHAFPFDTFVIQEKITDNYAFYFFAKCELGTKASFENFRNPDVSTAVLLYSPASESVKIVSFGGQIILEPRSKGGSKFLVPNNAVANNQALGNVLVNRLGYLLVQLSTKGVIKETEKASEKLNKKRASSGKYIISDTIYIRPGFYYDSDGKQYSVSENRTVKLHWRRGHLRGVRHGIGRAELKQVYIQPCLVNFKEGDEAPKHKTRVICA